MTTENGVPPGELVTRLAALLPAEPGRRLLHGRGATVTGAFEATPAAAKLSTARIFDGNPVPVTARFSGTRGGSHGHDAQTGDQGLAVRFTPADTPATDLIAFTLPVFFVRTGADLLGFLAAVAPDPLTGQPNPAAVADFLSRHPESAAAMAAGSDRAPSSYLGQRYHTIHAFGLTADDRTSWARLEWHPDVELPSLDVRETRDYPADYLTADLIRGLPAQLTLCARLPAAEDPVHDPTALWADPPRLIPLGRLRLEQPAADNDLDFDPLRLPPGMTAPLDRLSTDRAAVYRAARQRRHAEGSGSEERASPAAR